MTQGLVVLRDGGNPVYPGTTAGQLTFDLTGFTSYSIIATGNTPKAWTQFIPDGADRQFFLPRGVSINKNPASANFGKVYVSESRGGQVTGGRLTQDGIYVLRADGVADGGVKTGGVDWTVDGTAASAEYYLVASGEVDGGGAISQAESLTLCVKPGILARKLKS